MAMFDRFAQLSLTAMLCLPVWPDAPAAAPSAQEQVVLAERAFARTMADRDRQAFAALISQEAIFFGDAATLRGKDEIVNAWKAFFTEARAPFSWDPDQVEVLPSGTLALSTGLVRDRQGQAIARFNSIWRLEAPGTWRVVFDKGSPLAHEKPK